MQDTIASFFAYLSYSSLLHFAGFDYILHKYPAGQVTSDAKIPPVKRYYRVQKHELEPLVLFLGLHDTG